MDRSHCKAMLALALLSAGMLPAVPGRAGDAQDAGLGAEWQPIDPARLDDMRGGFQLPSGAMLSFGIERVVFINGQLTASMAVRVSDLSRISAAEAKALAAFNQGVVVQLGDGNRFDPVRTPGGLVIQNTLDNQQITTITRVDVGNGALGVFQDLNTSGALQDALIGSAGTR